MSKERRLIYTRLTALIMVDAMKHATKNAICEMWMEAGNCQLIQGDPPRAASHLTGPRYVTANECIEQGKGDTYLCDEHS